VRKPKHYNDATKAAVIAALLAGQGVSEVATAFNIDKSTVSRWKAALPTTQLQQIATEKKERLVDLVESHLRASLSGAVKIAEQAHDDAWRARQSAENLAVFYGVLSDKAFRLVEVAGRIFHDAEPPA
jgi:transposase-like protein